MNVAWNNSFRHIFSGFWRATVKPLQYFCQTLQISHFIDQMKLLFWRQLAMHNNNFLLSLSRLVHNWFLPRDAMHKRCLRRHAVSVCPSVRLSVTFVHFVKTSIHILRLFSPSDRPIILVFSIRNGKAIFRREPPHLTREPNAMGIKIITIFD